VSPQDKPDFGYGYHGHGVKKANYAFELPRKGEEEENTRRFLNPQNNAQNCFMVGKKNRFRGLSCNMRGEGSRLTVFSKFVEVVPLGARKKHISCFVLTGCRFVRLDGALPPVSGRKQVVMERRY